MKLLNSFLIALALYLWGALIGSVLKKLIKRYGYGVIVGGVINGCIISLLTLLIYLLW